MNITRGCKALAVIGAGISSGGLNPARGGIIGLEVFENAGSAPTAGLNLTVELVQQGSALHMVFANHSAIPAVITALYVEQTPSSMALLANPLLVQPFEPGVSFTGGAIPGNPPGSIASLGGPWQETLVSFRATAPGAASGIGPGESLTVQFDLIGSDLEVASAIGAADFRIVQHVQAMAGNASMWTVTVPAPGAMSLLLARAAMVRRRRR